MRRRLSVLLLTAACATFPAAASAGLIALRIEFRADAGARPRIFTLRCGEQMTGTVAHPAAACKRLQRLGPGAFRPTPSGTACTEISAGPSTARITGISFGRPLWVRFRLDNGCEIARWQRLSFLLPRPAPPR